MSNYTHQTAPTQFVEAAGIRFAYRRFANRRFGAKIDIPLLFFMHFTGTMDHWDPALTGRRPIANSRWITGASFPVDGGSSLERAEGMVLPGRKKSPHYIQHSASIAPGH